MTWRELKLRIEHMAEAELDQPARVLEPYRPSERAILEPVFVASAEEDLFDLHEDDFIPKGSPYLEG